MASLRRSALDVADFAYISLGRLRLVQTLLDHSHDSSADSILCVLGEDSNHNEGALKLANYLLLDAFKVDLRTVDINESNEDFVMLIRKNDVYVYCNPVSYQGLLLKRLAFWPNLHVYCMEEMKYDDEDETRDFKIRSVAGMLKESEKVGVPYSDRSSAEHCTQTMVQWPLVKSLVDFGSGFRVENFDVTDISPILQTKVYDIIDPLQLFKCLSHNVDQLQRQIENIGNLLDLKGSSEIGLITETLLSEILTTYLAFGRVSNRRLGSKTQPFVRFGVNSSKEKLDAQQNEKLDPPLTTLDALHFVIKGVEPFTNLTFTRTYFFGPSWNEGILEAGGDNRPRCDLRLLSSLYEVLVNITLSAIEVFSMSKSVSQTESYVASALQDHLVDQLHGKYRQQFGQRDWDFRLESFHLNGDPVILEEESHQLCFKHISLMLYDIRTTNPNDPGRVLGSLAFSESFFDSRILTKDSQDPTTGQVDTCDVIDSVFILTESVARYNSWNLPLLKNWHQTEEQFDVTSENLMSAEGVEVKATDGRNHHPTPGCLTVKKDLILFSCLRWGDIVFSLQHVEEVHFYDRGDDSLSLLVLRHSKSLRSWLPFSLQSDRNRIQFFIYPNSKAISQLRTQVIPFWQSGDIDLQLNLCGSVVPNDESDYHWMTHRLVSIGVTAVHGLTSFGSLRLNFNGSLSSLNRTRDNVRASSPAEARLLANFKDITAFLEHFLYDFCLGSRCLPKVETESLLRCKNINGDAAKALDGDGIILTIINGIPGSFKESLGSCLTSLTKEATRWILLRHPSDVAVFCTESFQQVLKSVVDAFHRRMQGDGQQKKKMRAVVVVPGFTSTAQVLACVLRHPDPDVSRLLRLGSVAVCVNPENMFVNQQHVMPMVLDHCARGFVNNIVVTGSSVGEVTARDEERMARTRHLLAKVNPQANLILAPRGKVDRVQDLDALLAENEFSTRQMSKKRHLLFPGWWYEDSKRHVDTVFGSKVWPHAITTISLKSNCTLDKTKFARELKLFKNPRPGSTGDSDPGVIFIATGESRFQEGGKTMVVNYSAAADSLTYYTKEPDSRVLSTLTPTPPHSGQGAPPAEEADSDKSPSGENFIIFSGYNLKETATKELLQRCTKGDMKKKSRRREEELTVRELNEIQRKNATKPMPSGWFFNGHAYVHLDGERSQNHPYFSNFMQQYLQESNEVVDEHNRKCEEQLDEFCASSCTTSC